MDLIDYNGDGRWSRDAITSRYLAYAAKLGVAPRGLSPEEHSQRGRHWVYPVMDKVIDGIEAGDPACVRLGVEFIEEDAKFPFGKILKSNTARALRRAPLTDEQRHRIRRRVLGMLRAGHVPHEFREYAKLLRTIGFNPSELDDVPGTSPRVTRFRRYLESAAARP
ncbi:MAG TPA: hypothetical protein VFB66_28965 [Tepidisphaeraceae bacterium]|nr:hypothetical protein [Tepidisphaeraceae bacterium]